MGLRRDRVADRVGKNLQAGQIVRVQQEDHGSARPASRHGRGPTRAGSHRPEHLGVGGDAVPGDAGNDRMPGAPRDEEGIDVGLFGRPLIVRRRRPACGAGPPCSTSRSGGRTRPETGRGPREDRRGLCPSPLPTAPPAEDRTEAPPRGSAGRPRPCGPRNPPGECRDRESAGPARAIPGRARERQSCRRRSRPPRAGRRSRIRRRAACSPVLPRRWRKEWREPVPATFGYRSRISGSPPGGSPRLPVQARGGMPPVTLATGRPPKSFDFTGTLRFESVRLRAVPTAGRRQGKPGTSMSLIRRKQLPEAVPDLLDDHEWGAYRSPKPSAIHNARVSRRVWR